ncbi:MAG: hypothetical protein QGI83_15755 [Candidatus Latescibacteria bacterium]|nr:hypothetical protein [Candidatus Latescibacterota bacterium]
MAGTWKPEPELLASLDDALPGLLDSQKDNGQFGTEPWVCGDQSVLLSLAAAWSLERSTHHRSEEVLRAIVKGGDALIDAQDDEGKWTFRKKDGSTWGQTLMPWTYSRWIRAYALVKEAMAEEERARWDAALQLGFEQIARTALGSVHNIPAHHAMALFCAGEVFGKEDWEAQARAFMQDVVAAQSPHGWWPEHKGPVVAYNFVYAEALGIYYSLSGDDGVLAALERAARYHASFTYPDGSMVETVDGRNPYHGGMRLGNVGFTHTSPGRGYLAQQHGFHLAAGNRFAPDHAAQLLLYGAEGETEPTAAGQAHHRYEMGDEALVLRQRPWFASLSALTVEIPQNRWGQDRQNFVSVYHDRTGLIVGGGNTKLQPLWSTFTIGDPSLLRHEPGDESPDFSPRGGLVHVPTSASHRSDGDVCTVSLDYGLEQCDVDLEALSDSEMRLTCRSTCASGMAVEAHVTLIPHVGEEIGFASCNDQVLGEEPVERSGEAWMTHAGWRLTLPENARVVWPALPHNPYRKGGEATIEEARLVVVVPLSKDVGEHTLTLQVL